MTPGQLRNRRTGGQKAAAAAKARRERQKLRAALAGGPPMETPKTIVRLRGTRQGDVLAGSQIRATIDRAIAALREREAAE